MLLATTSGCGPGQDAARDTVSEGDRDPSPVGDYPIHVIDDAGVSHRFDRAPSRILSLVPSATQTLLALGVGDRIVGRTDYDHRPELRELPSVGGGLQPNLEALIALEPDLVVRFEGESDRVTPSRLATLGITHFAIQPDGIRDVESSIRRLGAITGAAAAADTLLATIRTALDEVSLRVSELPRRRVMYLMGGEPPWVAGPGTYIHELMLMAGADNVFSDLEALYGPVSIEQLLARDIDLILASEGITAPPQLAHLERRPVPSWVEVPGPRLGDAALTIARLVHPGGFR